MRGRKKRISMKRVTLQPSEGFRIERPSLQYANPTVFVEIV